MYQHIAIHSEPSSLGHATNTILELSTICSKSMHWQTYLRVLQTLDWKEFVCKISDHSCTVYVHNTSVRKTIKTLLASHKCNNIHNYISQVLYCKMPGNFSYQLSWGQMEVLGERNNRKRTLLLTLTDCKIHPNNLQILHQKERKINLFVIHTDHLKSACLRTIQVFPWIQNCIK